jgi:integrase/recombinase XerD
MTALAATVQAFFTQRLIGQRRASPHTIAAYRDTIRLLLQFAAANRRITPSRLDIGDLNTATITAFLDHLEQQRGNSIRTRNARLAAIHSLFNYAATRHPEHAADISRVLAIPAKRGDHTIVTFLTDDEADALLASPDRRTRTGRRDHTLLLLAVQTGLRASELIGLTRADVHLGAGAYVACHGKGRKDRITPLRTRNEIT